MRWQARAAIHAKWASFRVLGVAGQGGRHREKMSYEAGIRVVMVIFVLRPLTQFFMQAYREGVRNEYYNVQLTPLPRLRPL